MIKSVFALVVLLHLCYNAEINFNLNVEIMDRLDQLHELSKQKKVNITSSGPLQVPVADHLCSCVGVFTRDLNLLLNNVSVSDDYTYLLQELKANLQALESQNHKQIECDRCQRTTRVRNSTMIFKKYISFLKKLNNPKKR